MSARAQVVLGRFPQHIAATDPGKRFGAVVGALADPLDVLTGQVGAVRAGHRLGEAPTVGDLLGQLGIHGLTSAAFAPVELRLRALAAATAADPIDPAAIAALVNLPMAALEPLGDELAEAAGRPARHAPSLRLRRLVASGVVGAHRDGNATPAALLGATAAYLGLEVEALVHTAERWWHLARCRDTIRVGELTPSPDLVALEENPFRRADLEPTPRRHGQRFRVLRGGLQDVDVGVRVRGVGVRTVRPAVVHLEAGQGLVYEGEVPDGGELVFSASGRVTLDGSDVTGTAWSFTGAVFASEVAPLPEGDFTFAGDGPPAEGERRATFAVTAPIPDAFEPDAGFPHGAPAVGPAHLPRGRSHWVGLTRLANFGTGASPAIPRTAAGRFDASVFADPENPLAPSFEIGFEWEEREPFAVRVLLPQRLSGLNDERGSALREPLRALLDRHRAAGVDVRVEYADPRWTLGEGVTRQALDDPLGTVIAGTQLWPDGTPQPSP